MTKEWEPAAMFDVLSDDVATEILAYASREPMSGRELVDRCDASSSTVYRRLDVLLKYDFLTATTRLDPDEGEYTVYETTLRGLELDIDDGRFNVDVRIDMNMAD